MLRNLRVQSKLIIVVAVPVLALAFFSALGARARLADLDVVRQFGDLEDPNAALGRLGTAIEDEAVASSWFLGSGGVAGTRQLAATRRATDRAVEALPEAIGDLAGGDVSGATVTSALGLSRRLDDLGSFRDDVDRLELPGDGSLDYLFELDGEALSVQGRVARDFEDPEFVSDVLNLVDLRQARAASAHQAAIVVGALTVGEVSGEGLTEFLAAAESEATHVGAFLAEAGTEELAAFDAPQAGTNAFDDAQPSRGESLLDALPAVRVDAAEWYDTSLAKLAVFDDGIDGVFDELEATASYRGRNAAIAGIFYLTGAVLAISAALGIAWAVGRSTVRPLKTLTRAARDVAQHQLPRLVESLRAGGEPAPEAFRPVRVASHDEIGDLARAFNTIQSVTIDVAREQSVLLRRGISDLFVNLARRNQSLIDRQIELIDGLEAHEEDPDVLRSLFSLDHLATRMRRNTESLLVLAGAEQMRRWREPISVVDVVRAASAEVADFSRVEIVGIDKRVAVTGAVAADLIHLVAELLENATAFSPPASPVVVAGSWSEAGFVLSVSDEGLGMAARRFAEVNRLLASPPAAGLALPRVLGLQVVGHLARRHGIGVELRPGARHGIAAVVTLPDGILAGPEPGDARGPAPRARADAPAPLAPVLPIQEQPIEEQPHWWEPPAPVEPAPLEPLPVEPAPVEPEPLAATAAPSSTGPGDPLPRRVPATSLEARVAGGVETPAPDVASRQEPLPPVARLTIAEPALVEPDIGGVAPDEESPEEEARELPEDDVLAPAFGLAPGEERRRRWLVRAAEAEHNAPAPSEQGGALPEVRPAAAPLPSRTPGDHLFHVPVVGSQLDVPTDAGDERALPSSRPDEVRRLLSEHRRGIERADTIEDDDAAGERRSPGTRPEAGRWPN